MANESLENQTEEQTNQKYITTLMRINTAILLVFGVVFLSFIFMTFAFVPDFFDWYITLGILLIGFELCYLFGWLITFPLRIWTYKISTHRGLMSQKFKNWALDWVKLLALNLIIFMPLLSLSVYSCYILRDNMIIAIITLLILIFALKFLKGYLALYLIHGFYRLKEGEKYEYWKDIALKNNIKNYPIFIVPIEHKTKYANAIAFGIKNTGYIICFDTLLNNLSKEQFASIMAHESAHILNNDMIKRLITMAIIIIAYIVYIQFIHILDVIPLIILTVVFFGGIIFLIKSSSKHSQKQEFKADAFAAKLLKNKEAIIEGLKYIHDINKYPKEHKKKGNFKYHPTLKERIEHIQNLDLEGTTD